MAQKALISACLNYFVLGLRVNFMLSVHSFNSYIKHLQVGIVFGLLIIYL
jgi:hypothetical protein